MYDFDGCIHFAILKIMETTPTLFDVVPMDDKEKSFMQYHIDNPHIYIAFERKAFQALDKGFQHYSGQGIFEILRWETGVKGNDEYKINNNFMPLYTRLFEKKHPQHKDFFRKRKSKFDKINQSNT